MATTRLRVKLLDYPYTAAEIAFACGFPKQRMSQYCLGQRPIPVHHLIRICAFLDCPPSDITGLADDEIEIAEVPIAVFGY